MVTLINPQGIMKNLVNTLQSLMDEAVETGLECGCQLTVYQDGELVADLAAGYIAPDRKTPVTTDTLFPVFSVGKAIMSTAIHRLVERGALTYGTRVADVWPEFGCEGKENILLWHLLTHRAALFQTPESTPEELADWGLMCSRVAAMRPEWKPGTRCQYHPYTFAWLAGETAARADGRSFREIVTDEVIRPLGLENELFFGTTPEADLRFAPADESATNGDHQLAQWLNIPAVRHGFIPSFNGVMNARAMAKHYAALDSGLLRPETLANASITRRAANDPIPSVDWQRFGLGYVTYDLSNLIGHGGALGSEGLLDRRRRLAVGFTKNKINPQHPNHPLRGRLLDALGLPPHNW